MPLTIGNFKTDIPRFMWLCFILVTFLLLVADVESADSNKVDSDLIFDKLEQKKSINQNYHAVKRRHVGQPSLPVEEDHWLSSTLSRIKRSINNIFHEPKAPAKVVKVKKQDRKRRQPQLGQNQDQNDLSQDEDGDEDNQDEDDEGEEEEYGEGEDEDIDDAEEDYEDGDSTTTIAANGKLTVDKVTPKKPSSAESKSTEQTTESNFFGGSWFTVKPAWFTLQPTLTQLPPEEQEPIPTKTSGFKGSPSANIKVKPKDKNSGAPPFILSPSSYTLPPSGLDFESITTKPSEESVKVETTTESSPNIFGGSWFTLKPSWFTLQPASVESPVISKTTEVTTEAIVPSIVQETTTEESSFFKPWFSFSAPSSEPPEKNETEGKVDNEVEVFAEPKQNLEVSTESQSPNLFGGSWFTVKPSWFTLKPSEKEEKPVDQLSENIESNTIEPEPTTSSTTSVKVTTEGSSNVFGGSWFTIKPLWFTLQPATTESQTDNINTKSDSKENG